MIHNPQEFIEKSKIYLGDARVMIKEEKDLIPYYTHLVAMASYNKEQGNVIHLSKSSFIDCEERDFLAWKIRDIITTFRKAKKEKLKLRWIISNLKNIIGVIMKILCGSL